MNRRGLLAFGAWALCLPCAATAYDAPGYRWPAAELPVAYTVNEALSDDTSDADALAALQMGFSVWNALECSEMRWAFAGRTRNSSWAVADGENVVTFSERSWNESGLALAVTSVFSDPVRIYDTDLKFNGVDHAWTHFSGLPASRDGVFDIAHVAAHEVGHALGLDHSGVPGSTMWPSADSNDISGRSLSADDIAGACALYETGAARPSPDSIPEPGPTPDPGQAPSRVASFDEDCTSAPCDLGLLCISDGTSSYCTRRCVGAVDCGGSHTCTRTTGGTDVCARGTSPDIERGTLGSPCARDSPCAAALTCVSDRGLTFCAGPCQDGSCAPGFACAPLSGGAEVCVPDDGGLPTLGQTCTSEGRCAPGLICLEDRGVRYCTRGCNRNDCGPEVTCVPIEPSGSACRFDTPPGRDPQPVPDSEDQPSGLGATCSFEPAKPACPTGLTCVETLALDGVLVDPGYCTLPCDRTRCCPEGFECAVDPRGGGKCRQGIEGEPTIACDASADEGRQGQIEAVATPNEDEPSDPLGCAGMPWLAVPVALRRPRRRKRSTHANEQAAE
jgi:hypothetical protein